MSHDVNAVLVVFDGRSETGCFYCRRRFGEFHEPGCVLAAENIPVLVTILNKHSGELRVLIKDESPFFGGHEENPLGGLEYRWGEGNESCDCNRANYFARAKNEPEPDLPPCGESRYAVRITRKDNGLLLYSEPPFTT